MDFFFEKGRNENEGSKLIYKFTLAINDVQQQKKNDRNDEGNEKRKKRRKRKFQINDKNEDLIKIEVKLYSLSLKSIKVLNSVRKTLTLKFQ